MRPSKPVLRIAVSAASRSCCRRPRTSSSICAATASESLRTCRRKTTNAPTTKASEADVREQVAFLLRIRDTVSAANNVVRTIRNLRMQIDSARPKVTGAAATSFATLSKTLLDSLTKVEEALYQTKNQAGEAVHHQRPGHHQRGQAGDASRSRQVPQPKQQRREQVCQPQYPHGHRTVRRFPNQANQPGQPGHHKQAQ